MGAIITVTVILNIADAIALLLAQLAGILTPVQEEKNSFIIAAIPDQDTYVAAVVQSQTSEEDIVVLAEKNASGEITKVTGGSFITADGQSRTFWFGDEGLPTVEVIGDWTFEYSNYTDNTVDVTIKGPGGATYQVNDVEFDAEIVNTLRQFAAGGLIGQSGQLSSANFSGSNSDFADGLRAASYALSLTCCLSSLGASATGVGAITLVVGGVACCTSTLLETVNYITGEDIAGTGGKAVSIVSCGISVVG